MDLGKGIAFLLTSLAYVWATSPLDDNSFLTHLATGRLILEKGYVPRTDPYTFTASGQRWVVQSWLASIVYALLERVGGLHAIQLFTGVLVATLVAQIWILTSECKGVVPRVGMTTCAVVVGLGFWSERPLLLGFNFLALTLLVLDGRTRIPRWTLLPLGWVWVNVHGSWILGLVISAVWSVGGRLDTRLGSGTGDWREPSPSAHGSRGERSWRAGLTCRFSRAPVWALLGAGCLLGCIGPLGWNAVTFPVQLIGKREVLANVVEWRPPPFDAPPMWGFAVQVVWLLLALARRPSYKTAVLGALSITLAMSAARNVPVASIAMTPLLASGSAGLGSMRSDSRGSPAFAFLACAAVIFGLTTAVRLRSDPFDWSEYPIAAFSWLVERRGADLGRVRLVSPDLAGNLSEALFGEQANAFYDDRFDMFPVEASRNASLLLNGRPAWVWVLEKARAEYALWYQQSGLGSLLVESDDWRVVFIGDGWVLAERRPREME